MKSTFFSSAAGLLLGSVCLLSTGTQAIVVDQCTLSLASLLGDQGLNSCVPINDISTLLSGNVSAITPKDINSTLTTFCGMPYCPNASIQLIQTTVKQNCANTTDPALSDLILSAGLLYPPAKSGLCATVSPTNATFCTTVVAQNLLDYAHAHPSPLGLGIFANATVLKQYVDNMPVDLLCTDCTKSMINPLVNYVAKNASLLTPNIMEWVDVIETEVQAKCGKDFTNGATPSTGTSSNGESPATSIIHSTSIASSLVVVAIFSAFALVF
ncbi:hypothetical protein BGZ76_003008 [Entomortierella beljakovae]|nr:hypothetical protein BGZ76_003008 [Entomortierella beljakovae]